MSLDINLINTIILIFRSMMVLMLQELLLHKSAVYEISHIVLQSMLILNMLKVV